MGNFLTIGLSTMESVGTLFVFIFLGYFFSRKKIIPSGSGATLSKLTADVFFACYIFEKVRAIRIEELTSNSVLAVSGVVFFFFATVVALLVVLFFKKSPIDRKTLVYLFTFGNYGYFGSPVIEKVCGADFVAKMILFTTFMTIMFSTYGYFLLTGDKDKPLWKMILSPSTISVVAGVAVGLSGLQLPSFVNSIVGSASACMSPISMLLVGVVLSKYDLKDLVRGGVDSYMITFVRLIALPLLAGLIFYPLTLLFPILKPAALYGVVVSAMPAGLNTVVFVEAAGKDSSQTARICFLTFLFSLIVLPIILGLTLMLFA